MIRFLILALGLMASSSTFSDIENPCADLSSSLNAMLDQAGWYKAETDENSCEAFAG